MKGMRKLGLEYEEDRRQEAHRWAEFYSAVGMQAVSFSALVLPEYCVGYDRLIAVHYSMTTTTMLRLISADREWRVERGITREDLLSVRSRRYDVMQGRESYAILTKDRSHPDMMFVEVSELPTRVKVIGLQEYLLMVWQHWAQTGHMFGGGTMTVCADSRFPDGTVPTVGFSGKILFIGSIREDKKGMLHGIRTVAE